MQRKVSRRQQKEVNYSEIGAEIELLGSDGVDEIRRIEQTLSNKKFKKFDIEEVKGHELTKKFIFQNGFRNPFTVKEKEGLGMKVPSPQFSVRDVLKYIGEDFPLSVIEVSTQNELYGWKLGQWVEYYDARTDSMPALNVISLEFSQTKLRDIVQSPKMVREVEWIENIWPAEIRKQGVYPRVQYYCLMSLAGSYTDFHVDFGGSSVWYHVLRGKKVFYLIRPTKENLYRYEEWSSSADQAGVFLGDLVENCYEVVLEVGTTFFIPTGWIHAVYTPIDSLVFGGNYLHSFNMKLQIDIQMIEDRTGVQSKFRFPYFKEIQFYAAGHYATILKKLNMTTSLQEELLLTHWELEGIPWLIEYCQSLIGNNEMYMNEAKSSGFQSATDLIQQLKQELGVYCSKYHPQKSLIPLVLNNTVGANIIEMEKNNEEDFFNSSLVSSDSDHFEKRRFTDSESKEIRQDTNFLSFQRTHHETGIMNGGSCPKMSKKLNQLYKNLISSENHNEKENSDEWDSSGEAQQISESDLSNDDESNSLTSKKTKTFDKIEKVAASSKSSMFHLQSAVDVGNEETEPDTKDPKKYKRSMMSDSLRSVQSKKKTKMSAKQSIMKKFKL